MRLFRKAFLKMENIFGKKCDICGRKQYDLAEGLCGACDSMMTSEC